MKELTDVEKVLVYRRREQLAKRAQNWDNSMPTAMKGHDFNTLLESNWSGHISPAATMEIKKWMDNPSPFLLLHGASGLGKTLMAMLIVGNMIREGKADSVLYVPSTRLLDGLSDYSDRQDGGMLARVKRPHLVLLDDIGSGGMELSPARKTGLWDIIDYRWSHNKPTIITTNLAVSESKTAGSDSVYTVEDYVGTSAWDRITDRRTDIAFIGTTHRVKQDESIEDKRRARAERRKNRQ